MEKMIFVIRKAIEEDIPKIYEITKTVFNVYAENVGITGSIPALGETYEDIKNDIKTKEVFVAILDEEVIGSVRIEVKPDKTAYLSRFGVQLDYQSIGVGKILMNAVDSAMINLGITNLYLHTASKMLSLIKFYYGRGFYIELTTKERGYIRALLRKDYEIAKTATSLDIVEKNRDAI
jgi:ribosomal protein S18 acetylase RimI-like enzyme